MVGASSGSFKTKRGVNSELAFRFQLGASYNTQRPTSHVGTMAFDIGSVRLKSHQYTKLAAVPVSADADVRIEKLLYPIVVGRQYDHTRSCADSAAKGEFLAGFRQESPGCVVVHVAV